LGRTTVFLFPQLLAECVDARVEKNVKNDEVAYALRTHVDSSR